MCDQQHACGRPVKKLQLVDGMAKISHMANPVALTDSARLALLLTQEASAQGWGEGEKKKNQCWGGVPVTYQQDQSKLKNWTVLTPFNVIFFLLKSTNCDDLHSNETNRNRGLKIILIFHATYCLIVYCNAFFFKRRKKKLIFLDKKIFNLSSSLVLFVPKFIKN